MELGGIGAIAGMVGSGLNLLVNPMLQQDANRRNQMEGRRMWEWQGNMANTAHQREVRDLQAAGLNPILSAGGNGASSPSPGTASITAPQIDSTPILNVASLLQNQQRIDIDKANSAAGIAKSLSETELNKAKKVLTQKGIIRSNAEGALWKLIQDGAKKLRQHQQNSKPPAQIQPGFEIIRKP